ncbi:hypothetical protein HAZT_HAZT004037 [Hyalella azteca]|uniref:Uncharacterized protein n=1 Tax=Hyalella azteca TaxID=294128 RepID=A0A6A0GYV7_HYAAZ|nr:hypothetical protein HAZT_HAZT004037 [Hyalella azteca]
MLGWASIGLDLGSGKCCVASVRAGAVTVLPNAHGDKTTPSFVAFTDSRSLVGSDARDQAALNPENTFYGVKTVLGRSFDKNRNNELAYIDGNEIRTREKVMMNFLPEFSITEEGSPSFKIRYKNKELMLHAEEITALLIAKMKSVAEDNLGSAVTNAVISVPVNFSNSQRQATLDAARIAGLVNVTLINSTTAAAIAYWDQHPTERDCVAVVDFGASSQSLAILSIDNGTVKVLEAYGGSTVSGNRIDFCMMRAIVTKFQEKHGKFFEESPRALVRLRTATEKLKFNLTLLTSSALQVDSLSHGIDFTTTFPRQEMEESCKSQFEILGNVLRRWAKSKNWAAVRTVVLVGGSTRIPAVEKLIAETLGKPLDHSLNKDEAVACGAALRAAELCCSTPREVEEVLSRRINFEAGAESGIIVETGARVPDDFNRPTSNGIWKRNYDHGMRIFENISENDDKIVRTIALTTIGAGQLGRSPSSGALLFTIDESGIVRIELISCGKARDIPIGGLLSDKKRAKICLGNHKMFLDDEAKLKENENAINDLETFCLYQLEKLGEKFGHDSAAFKLCKEILTWLENTPEATKQECDQKRIDLANKIYSVFNCKNLPTEPAEQEACQLDSTDTYTSNRALAQPLTKDRGRPTSLTDTRVKYEEHNLPSEPTLHELGRSQPHRKEIYIPNSTVVPKTF